jgi:predicted NBD/HSP70 family sugar kinase
VLEIKFGSLINDSLTYLTATGEHAIVLLLHSLNKVTMPVPTTGNRDLIRAINRSLVLNTIKRFGPIARAAVARRTGLSPATVTGITAELIKDDLIFEKETGDSRGGRRPILLALHPNGGYVIGIKLTETQVIGALTDLEATVLGKKSKALGDRHPSAVIRTLADLVEELHQQAHLPRKKLLGVGIGLAGIVDSERGVLRQSPFFGWKNLPLRSLLQERIQAPVYVDNDVNTLTLAEKWFGAGQGVENFLTVTIGRGVGLGVVVNGQFYRGAGGGAGEFGHITVDPQGPLCPCGKRGCLEAFVGEPALIKSVQSSPIAGTIQSVDELIALAEGGDATARELFARAGAILGQAIANLVNVFNPQRIVIGGEGVRIGDWIFDPMRTTLHQHAVPELWEDLELKIEPWGDDAWARGAASLVLRELFESPMNREPASIAFASS